MTQTVDRNSATTASPDRAARSESLTSAAASPAIRVEASEGLQVGPAQPLPHHLDGVPCEWAGTSRDCPRQHLYTKPGVRRTALVDRPRPGTLVSYLSSGERVGPFLVTSLGGRTDHLVLEGPAGLFEHYFDAGFNTFPA